MYSLKKDLIEIKSCETMYQKQLKKSHKYLHIYAHIQMQVAMIHSSHPYLLEETSRLIFHTNFY
jgi:hypothetical protein